MRLRLLLPALMAPLVGCTGYLSTASAVRAQFVHDATCPSGRVTVAHAGPKTPPPEVAADPGRLALWNDEAKKSPDYVASGCGQERRYACVAYGDYPYHYTCTPQ
ncbi:MAG TPA: hypothetical protein VGL86_14020 [Polyangia bacterium]|jgi:hypothetical protein